MDKDTVSSKLNGIIAPEHLLQAIQNALEHSGETAHGMTGLAFKHYTIIVRKKAGLNWAVECRFRKAHTNVNVQPTKRSRSQCQTRQRKP